MKWNWQQTDWPRFTWETESLKDLEAQFLRQSGVLIGSAKHFKDTDKKQLIVDIMTDEAMNTSEIEGEYLNRDSVQSSIRKNFGLDADNKKIPPAERGIANVMTNLYQEFNTHLSHDMMFTWHKMLTDGRTDIQDIGRYRMHEDPMQVISNALHEPKVHFEAPPSKQVKSEMDQFLKWFYKEKSLPALTRAGIAHLYFVCIHPFEDGNGRIGRAIAEKSLSETIGEPTLIALSQSIMKKKKDYYRALEINNKDLEITNWLIYFAKTILDAQQHSLGMIEFLIQKTKFYDRIKGQLNNRQEKVIERIFREGLNGFKGGLSAENYITITGTSRATATRDLNDLVTKEFMRKTGELKGTRYYLELK